MDNKLVFEPTTLTQYNWNKYQLIENRTYKWDKYEAVPEYLYTYYWNKYEAVPPGLTNRWDIKDSNYAWDYEYDENLILQNVKYDDNVYAGNIQSNFLRVLRNQNVVSDNNFTANYDNSSGGNPRTAKMRINSSVKGAYLFLTPAVPYSGGAGVEMYYNGSYRSFGLTGYRYLSPDNTPPYTDKNNYHKYLARTLKDITQKTNLVDCHDIFYDTFGNKRTYTEAKEKLQSYFEDGYQFYFQTRPTYFPEGDITDAYTPTTHTYTFDAYENGFLLGASIKTYDELHRQQGGVYEPPTNTFRSTDSLDNYTGTDCQFNDCLWPHMYSELSKAPKNINTNRTLSYIGILTDNAGLDIDLEIINTQNEYNLCMAHELTYKHYKYNKFVNSQYSDYSFETKTITQFNTQSDDSFWFNIFTKNYFTSNSIKYAIDTNIITNLTLRVRYSIKMASRPGNLIVSLFNQDINAYPKKQRCGDGTAGYTDEEWIVYYGEVPMERYTPGSFIETVESNIQTTYPEDDEQNGYYYIYQRYIRDVIEWHIGVFIEKITDTVATYPINGVYPDNYEDTTHYWYSYLGYDSQFFKGDFVSAVSSYIEAAYPQNSYVISDGWYEYIGSADIIVGQLIIDSSLLMGGVNYTQEINPSEDLQIGTPGAAQIDFTIFAPDASAATQYLGKDFTYYVKMNSDNDWRQIGTFTLTKAELPDKQTAKIQGFDYIYKFDTIIDEWLDEQTFPMTLGNMFASLCEYVGCEAYSTDFTNSDFMVNDNFEAVQITGRTILQYITEASGGFCVAEPDGRIHLKHYAIPPTGAVNLGNNSYRKYTHEIYNVPVISSVVVRKDDDDEGVESNV